MNKPASTWTYENGRLTVSHLGESVSLGRYANREFAARAAAAYFAGRGGRVKHVGPNAGNKRGEKPSARTALGRPGET
jgi:hypothetical protein